MARHSRALSRRHESAFTLLEMLAVLLVMALLMSLVLPGLGAMRASALRSEARSLASQLEYARQQSVVSGVTHRLLIEVDTGGYRIESYVTDDADEADPFAEPDEPDLRGSSPLSLAPPATRDYSFQPISNSFGGNHYLGEAFHFAGVQTAEGWLEDGDAGVVFDRDGTSDHVEIVIADGEGLEITLEVEPLLEIVRIREGE